MPSFASTYCVVSISPKIWKTLLWHCAFEELGSVCFCSLYHGNLFALQSVFSFHCLLPYRGRSSMMINNRTHLLICGPYHCIMLRWPWYATLILIIHSVILTSWLLRVHPMASTTTLLLFRNALTESTLWVLNLPSNGAIMKSSVHLIDRDSWSLPMQMKMRRRESSKKVRLRVYIHSSRYISSFKLLSWTSSGTLRVSIIFWLKSSFSYEDCCMIPSFCLRFLWWHVALLSCRHLSEDSNQVNGNSVLWCCLVLTSRVTMYCLIVPFHCSQQGIN